MSIDKHLDELKQRISELTQKYRIPLLKLGYPTVERPRGEPKSKKRRVRRIEKRHRVIEEAETSESTGDSRKLHQTIRKIGVKDAQTIKEDFFRPAEYRLHLLEVSSQSFERTTEEIEAT